MPRHDAAFTAEKRQIEFQICFRQHASLSRQRFYHRRYGNTRGQYEGHYAIYYHIYSHQEFHFFSQASYRREAAIAVCIDIDGEKATPPRFVSSASARRYVTAFEQATNV